MILNRDMQQTTSHHCEGPYGKDVWYKNQSRPFALFHIFVISLSCLPAMQSRRMRIPQQDNMEQVRAFFQGNILM